MPLPGIPPWTDQNIELFHGTVLPEVASILSRIDLRKSKPLKDFGRGFYTTTKLSQAEHWANQLAGRRGQIPAVIRFSVARNELALMESLTFVRGDAAAVDFWSFVQFCRTIDADHRRQFKAGFYDVVAGPVTGSWKEQTIVPDSDRVTFHTDHAVSVLDGSQKGRVV